jgi:hypothetical protein
MHSKALAALLLLGSAAACAEKAEQDPGTADEARLRQEQCFEIAHRIACNSTEQCQEGEADGGFERRHQAEMMIGHLCTDGPRNFDEYYWVDIDGKYRPYYKDSNGNKSKLPPLSQ